MSQLKQRLFGSGRGAAFFTSRIIGSICTLVLLALSAKMINALVMTHTTVGQPLPIVVLVVSTLSTLYLALSFFFFIGTVKTGTRFLIMASIDTALFLIYLAASVTLGLDVAALSCGQSQFTATSLNRYGMGYFDFDHTILSWAKSSYHNCQSAKAIWVMCIILAIVFISSAIVMIYIWFQEYRGANKNDQGGKV